VPLRCHAEAPRAQRNSAVSFPGRSLTATRNSVDFPNEKLRQNIMTEAFGRTRKRKLLIVVGCPPRDSNPNMLIQSYRQKAGETNG
jgi:hypothetical protein